MDRFEALVAFSGICFFVLGIAAWRLHSWSERLESRVCGLEEWVGSLSHGLTEVEQRLPPFKPAPVVTERPPSWLSSMDGGCGCGDEEPGNFCGGC